jgi:hypothetical protein
MAADVLRALKDLGGSPDAATPSDRALLRSAVPRTPQPMSRPSEVSPPPPRPVTPAARPAPAFAPAVPQAPLPLVSRRGLSLGLGGALVALVAGVVAVVVMRQPATYSPLLPQP